MSGAASVTRRAAGVLEDSAVIVHSLKTPGSAFRESQNWHQVQSKWKAAFLRKYLRPKGMPIQSLINKAFDSCFGHLLLRSEMTVFCLLLTKAASGAWPHSLTPEASCEQVGMSYGLWERGQKDRVSVFWKR